MLIDTSLLPDLNDTATWDDSGGDQKEKRPGGKDLGDEMESDNDTESNANIIAADDGNINSNSGESLPTAEEIRVPESTDCSMLASRRSVRNPVAKATTEQPKDMWAELVEEVNNEQPQQSSPAVNQSDDRADWVKRMIALSKQKREETNDGWKQCESVPPVGIQGEIKKSDSGIAVKEGKEFRQRDELVIESREITQPEATERHETHEAEQSQGQQETVSEKADKDWRGGDYYSYTSEGCAHRAFDRAIKYKSDDKTYWQTKGIFLTIASAARRNEAGEWVTKMTISSLTGDTHGNASRKIKGWIERLEKAGLLIPLETSKRDGRAW
ncbi:hypothetical protein BON98_22210, partial [Escherichia coli]|uniref:hypothetical protein n=1 Tax=Escherichia coli TaxID=562 RepID=UPI001068627B